MARWAIMEKIAIEIQPKARKLRRELVARPAVERRAGKGEKASPKAESKAAVEPAVARAANRAAEGAKASRKASR